MDICSRQVYYRITDRELVPGSVTQSDAGNLAVVGRCWCSPGDRSSAASRLARHGHLIGKPDELRCLVVTDGDKETGGSCIGMDVGHRVGNLCATNRENVT